MGFYYTVYTVIKLPNFNKHADPYRGDPYHNEAYFGDTIQPHDVIFYKNNRGLTTEPA
jgi:hypothetical protein